MPISIRRGQSRESDDSTPAEQRKAAAPQILNELVPTPPADRPAAWRIVAQRSSNDLGVPAMLFQIGAVLQHEIIVLGPPSAPLPGIEIELLDRFDRVITGRSVFLAAANRIAWGAGSAIAIVLRLPMDVVAGEYVFRLALKGPIEDVVRDSVMSNAISVYNALPFPPFHGIVGLPAQFRVEGRGTSGSGYPKAEARTD
jgi:hypothetical protein